MNKAETIKDIIRTGYIELLIINKGDCRDELFDHCGVCPVETGCNNLPDDVGEGEPFHKAIYELAIKKYEKYKGESALVELLL